MQIGLNLKILVDHIPSLRIIATGSSSFDLAKDIGEPLTGRKTVLKLLPLAQMEIAQMNIRNDIGELWENYVITERLKKQEYLHQSVNAYFWRTYDKKEIDLVEEHQSLLAGFEIKWKRGPGKFLKAWMDAYPGAAFDVINQENYLTFIQ